ncbi:MAG TPA: GFA family protein [Sphingomicrobium sp.]|nr:GFA family protein [Sphingomicrobium sp.]
MGLTGGCMRGTVRYELKSDPFDCGWCHCRTCQLSSGTPAQAFAGVPRGDWVATSGSESIRTVHSSSFGQRFFCRECGTPLFVTVEHQPDTLDFSAVTLDNPNAVPPEYHIFWGSKIAWFNPADDLPRHERFRPNTVGLDGTEPPDDSSLVGGA